MDIEQRDHEKTVAVLRELARAIVDGGTMARSAGSVAASECRRQT